MSAAVGYQHRFNPHQHHVDGSLNWTPVQDLEIRTELYYTKARQTGANAPCMNQHLECGCEEAMMRSVSDTFPSQPKDFRKGGQAFL